jgi:TonB family protein
MMPAIDRIMLAAGGSLAASVITKATLTTVLALIGARLAHRSRAAMRHALLAAAFGALLALPVASVLSPPVDIAVRIATQAPVARPSAPSSGAVSSRLSSDAVVAAASSNSWRSALSMSNLLLAGWIVGFALSLLPMAAGVRQVRSLRRSGVPWQLGNQVVERLALAAGIRRRVDVLLHEALPGPMTCGVAHPAIVLPLDAQNWETEDLNRAIIHELEHVRRGDWAIHCLTRAVCAAYWFHPLVWIAWRQLALEAERACDDAVLGRSEATAYADQLVGLARRLSAAAKSPALAMANRADLTKRVGAVLDSRQRRGRLGALPLALASAAAVALVLTVSPLRMVAAQQSVGSDSGLKPAGRLSVSTDLVLIDVVTVSDRNGKRIEGLKAGDFVLTEDGVAQTISIFEFQKVDSGLSYYILGYYTTDPNLDGRFRKVQIALKDDPAATLEYRPGYYASKVFTRVDGTQKASAPESAATGPAPHLIRKVEPDYSEEARKAKFQGHVVLDVEVDTSGDVVNPKVMRSLGLGLDEKAIEAVSQWKFKPAMKDGSPVSVIVEVEFNFRLL